MRAAVVGMVLLCGIAQAAEPSDADRTLGEDHKAAVVAYVKKEIVFLEKQRIAAIKNRDQNYALFIAEDIKTAKTELKKVLKKTVEVYAKEAAKNAKSVGTIAKTIGIELVEIPAGNFIMGDVDDAMGDLEDAYAVTLSEPFWLGKTEVTQGQWKQVMGTEPWEDGDDVQSGDTFPASAVSWNRATTFCRLLTYLEIEVGKLKPGESYHLPTEAQWEYACSAGTTTRYSFGDDDDGKQLGQYAWFDGNTTDVGEDYAHKVGMKKPNPWGLYDMHGNVGEWCSDWYGEKLLGGIDSVGPEWGSRRVRRGGGFADDQYDCRSKPRNGRDPSFRSYGLGFRVARSQSAQ